MTVQVDTIGLDFYTAQSSAFARDGKAAVAAFQKSGQALARSPGPHDSQVVDTFSLRGFSGCLRGDQQGMSGTLMSDTTVDLTEAERARILAKSALFDPPPALPRRWAARADGPVARRTRR